MSETTQEKHPNELTFDAVYGRKEQMSGVLALVTLIAAAFAFQVWMSGGGADTLLLKILGFIPIALAGVLWFGSPRRYTLGRDSLQIHSAFFHKTIPYKEIQSVESFREGEIEFNDESPFPSSLMTHLHLFSHPVYGKIKSNSNTIFPAVIIATQNEALLLSSNDNSKLVKVLKERID